LSEELFLCITF